VGKKGVFGKDVIALGILQNSPTFMYEDRQAEVAVSNENTFHNRSKHMSLSWSYGGRYFLLISTSTELCTVLQQIVEYSQMPITCNQLRSGTPLSRSLFMPARNTERIAIVLTHPSTCFSHTQYHYRMAVS